MSEERILSICFDTETTGLIDRNLDLGDEHQPHVLQLGAILFDDESGEVIDTIDTLIKPDRWIAKPIEDGSMHIIHPKAFEAHGITLERCEAEGVPMSEVLPLFNAMKVRAKRRIAFNLGYDKKMIARAALHLGLKHEKSEFDDFDVMFKSTSICKLPKPNGHKGYKWPKLTEAYQHFFGKSFDKAHSAFGDATATKDIYMLIKTPIAEAQKDIREAAERVEPARPVVNHELTAF